jgi:hypothetical protein
MKAHIVNEVQCRIVNGCIHFGYFFLKDREMFLPATLRRQRCEIRFEQPTRFKKLRRVETMQSAENPEGRLAYQRRTIGDKSADTVADLHNPRG